MKWHVSHIAVFNSSLRPESWHTMWVATLAQLVEHPPCKRTVVGSSPTGGSIFYPGNRLLFSPVFSSFRNIFESNKFGLSQQQMLRWLGKLATVHPAYAKVRPLRRIFIAKLLSTALGLGSVTAPAHAASTTPSADSALMVPSAVVAGKYYIKSALADDLVLDVWAASRDSGANVQLWRASGSDAQSFAFIQTKPSVSAKGQADIAPGYYFVSSGASRECTLDR